MKTITVTDSTGATRTINTPFTGEGDADIGEVRVDSNAVGIVRKLSTGLIIVRYTDGTFESLVN